MITYNLKRLVKIVLEHYATMEAFRRLDIRRLDITNVKEKDFPGYNKCKRKEFARI
jgi:hypothetical protein